MDLNETGEFHLFLSWNTLAAMNDFKHSDEYNLLKGAIQTLGKEFETFEGKLKESNTV